MAIPIPACMRWPGPLCGSLAMDSMTTAAMHRHGLDPGTLDAGQETILRLLYGSIPDPPVSAAATLSCAAAAAATDGARTAVLSTRWHGLWRSAPLVVDDTQFLPDGGADGRPPRPGPVSRAVRRAVSAALRSHPGPFPFVSLSCGFISAGDADRATLARWFHLLATKGVHELVFVNRPWLIQDLRLPPPPLPWRVEDRDLEFLITVCPVLDALAVLGDLHPLHARIASQSLRSAQFCFSFLIEVAVEDAPSLERLFVWRCWDPRRSAAKLGTRIKIGNAPRLSIVGYLEPGVHELQIGKTIIKSGTMPCPKTVIPTVQMLALHLHFGVRNEVRMLPSFLRCFPNVETLCIESEPTCEPTGNINIKFWQEKAPIECIRSHLKTLVLREFHGEENEVAFLKFVAETAQVLEKMVLVMTLKEPSAREELAAKMKDLDSARWASGSSKVGYLFSRIAEGSRIWNMRAGLDSSCNDPFYCL
nr:unnamed protein product [Digitaria exilis]